MIFAQFYQMSTGYIPGTIPPQFGERKIIEASGDKAVIIIDGRLLETFQDHIARSECLNRGYIGYSIHKGESFTRSTIIKPFQSV